MIEEWKIFGGYDKTAFRGFDLEHGHTRAECEREKYVKNITNILKVLVFLLSVIMLCFTGAMLWNNYWQGYQYTPEDLAEVKVEPSHLHIGVQIIKDVDEDAMMDLLSAGSTKSPGQDSVLSEIIKAVPLELEDIKDFRTNLAKDLTAIEKVSQSDNFNVSKVDIGKLVKPYAEGLNERLSYKSGESTAGPGIETTTERVICADENFNSAQLKTPRELPEDESYEYDYDNTYDQPIYGSYEDGKWRHKNRNI